MGIAPAFVILTLGFNPRVRMTTERFYNPFGTKIVGFFGKLRIDTEITSSLA
ncbi:hypothetical protein EDF70_101464 [Neorhizobium sp. JUb45]|nr:hypothetical protein EDF70_101464 [Neorhizobium sp. JUb45]